MKILTTVVAVSVAVSLLFTADHTLAQDADEKMLDAARCYACHQMAEASLGPPYQAIAARHGANKDVMLDVLARKIVDGGGGNWGNVPMVPNQWVNIEEARAMAAWILSLSPTTEPRQ